MESAIYHAKQLLWLIILHLCVDVHSCFAVFMPCKVLDSLRVHPGIQQVGDIGVAQQMWCHMELNRPLSSRQMKKRKLGHEGLVPESKGSQAL